MKFPYHCHLGGGRCRVLSGRPHTIPFEGREISMGHMLQVEFESGELTEVHEDALMFMDFVPWFVKQAYGYDEQEGRGHE